jgi:mannose-1-phosphate guanylyltransferase
MADGLWAVILAGGVGSRFWPVSTPRRPKQLLPLAGKHPLIRQTVERIRPLVPDSRIRILAGAPLAGPILEAVPGLGTESLLIEPAARGTGPVLAWAAAEIARTSPDAVMISLHADHVIEPAAEFRALLDSVGRAAVTHGRLFTIGAQPTRPETGYGYIRAGHAMAGEDGCFEVEEFIEKPNAEDAESFIAQGFLWNTGLFVWPVSLLLEEIRRHTPEIAEYLPLLEEGRTNEYFERVPVTTIDEGLLERSDKVAVVKATFRWDDVGAWDAVARTQPLDEAGNVIMGDAFAVESRNCIMWADSGAVVVYGGDDLVVVQSGGITFVAPRDRTPDLKRLLARLPDRIAKPDDAG